jgi:hypothetical protein
MDQIIDGKLYSTNSSTLIAQNHSSVFRTGDDTMLYKTGYGSFFVRTVHDWERGPTDFEQGGTIRPISVDEAKKVYKQLQFQKVGYEDTFGIGLEGV